MPNAAQEQQLTPAWPPANYNAIFADRHDEILRIENDPVLIQGIKSFYSNPNNIIPFIEEQGVTIDPRNSTSTKPVTMPFVLFDRQKEFVQFIMACLQDQECGLTEKSRDMGATWLAVAISVWIWLYMPGASVGWGSRKEMLVDRLGDLDSIFEKIRRYIDMLPDYLLPEGFELKKHAGHLKVINPENGASITGEAGDEIGRGGRKTIYFKDESSFYEHPESIEGALGDNTRVQIDISSVNNTATIFNRRRKQGQLWTPEKEFDPGIVRVFIFDWRDHPLKTQDWYDIRKAKYQREGLVHIFSREVDRDASASTENILIPAIWVNAAIDAHKRFDEWTDDGMAIAGLDVADDGGDQNSFVKKKANIIRYVETWEKGDPGETTRKTVALARIKHCWEIQYDCIGVGSGVKSEANRLTDEGVIKKNELSFIKWDAGAAVLDPDEEIFEDDEEQCPLNKDFFENLNAQAGWNLRWRFERTYEAVVKGIKHDINDLISIDSSLDELEELKEELSQPTYKHNSRGKTMINKKPEGAKSPNRFDAVKQVFWPITEEKVFI